MSTSESTRRNARRVGVTLRCVLIGAIAEGCGRHRYDVRDAAPDVASVFDVASVDAPACARFVRYDQSGAGSETDPFLLCAAEQLRSMAAEETPTGAFFRLQNDIDLGASAFTPIGSTRAFEGTLDGGGHTISGLRVLVTGSGGAGLFASATDTRITNLTLRDAQVVGVDASALLVGRGARMNIAHVRVEGSVSGRTYVGGVVGTASDTQVSDTRAAVVIESTDRFVGGAIGQLQRGSVTRVLVTGSATTLSDPERCYYVGGIVGDLDAGTIGEAAADIVLGNSGGITGGIVGWASRSEIHDVWSTGEASGGAAGVAPGGRVDAARYLCSGPAGWSYVGGVIGASIGTNLERSGSAMTLTGTGNNVGGIVAQNITSGTRRGSVARSFAATELHGPASTGAITETLEADVIDVYFDTSVMGLTRACGGSCRPDTGMGRGIDGAMMPTYFQTARNAPMSTWDFTAVWSELPGSYPVLRNLPPR